MSDSIASLNLENLDADTFAPPESRLKDACQGRKCFKEMQRQDSDRGMYRTRIQAILDGEPPFDQAILNAKGQGGRTNVNWGDPRSVMDSVESGLIDWNVAVESLVSVFLLKQAVPDDEIRFNLENILAEEITRTIRNWAEYDRSYLELGRICFWHGVSIAYFEDNIDWRFQTSGLGDFVIPSGTEASENLISVAGCLRYMEVHKLYSYIRDEGLAASMGWNVPLVQQAIVNAIPEHRGSNWTTNAWMQIQKEMRSNDLGMSLSGRTSKVGIIHMWVPEFDGTVSKYITTYDDPRDDVKRGQNEDWLYTQKRIYPEMRRGMVFFTYGVGEHGTYHSIGGLGRRVFPVANALNRAMCTMLDAAIAGAGIFMQPESEAVMSKMKLVPIGGAMTLLPAKEHGEMILRPMPDLSHGIQPIIEDFRNTMGRRAGQFQGSNSPFASPVEKTRFEVAAQLESLGKVGATQSNLWNAPWGRLMREMVRRMCRLDYMPEQPGGEEVADFHRRLLARGFPLELLQAIDFDATRAERAIGSGSGASRIGRLTQLKEYAGELGETGRHRLNRDLIAATLEGDYDQADRYIPREPEPTPPIDTQFANLENMMVKLGQEPMLAEGQMPMVHLGIHIPFLMEMAQSTQGREDLMIELAEPMLVLHTHCIDTLEQVQDSASIEQQVAQYRQVLQQLGEIVGNAVSKAIAAQEEQAAETGDQSGDAANAALQMKMAEAKIKLDSIRTQASLKMQIEEERAMQKARHKEEEFRQNMAHKDAGTAAELLVNARKKLAETAMQQKREEDALKLAKLKRGNPREKSKESK